MSATDETRAALRIVQDRGPEIKTGRLRYWRSRFESLADAATAASAEVRRWQKLADEFPDDSELQAVAYRRARESGYLSVQFLEREIQKILKSLSGKMEADE